MLQIKNIDSTLDSLFKSSVPSTFANPKCFIEQNNTNESTVEKEAIPELRELKRKEMDELEEEEQNSKKAIRLQKEKDREAKRQTPEEQEKLTRTIFVGNVPRCVSEKEHLKAFKNEFKVFGEIQSIRFRSIAFSKPGDRKIGYLQKEFHQERDTFNAYIVFKNGDKLEDCISTLNGHAFQGHHLRVDWADPTMTKKKPKQTIFIGNLPFNVQDEKVYHFFSECGEIQYVRMIRDKITNVGKGIGYVMFKDKASVSLALKLDGQVFEKRPIRITRCLKDPKTEEKPVKSYQGEVSNAEKRIKLKRKTLKQPKKKVSEEKKRRIIEKKVRQFKQKEQKRKK